LDRHADQSGDRIKFLNIEIKSLKKNIAVLESDLSNEQNYSQEMNDLSNNLKNIVDKLQAQQNKTFAEIEESRDN
jgi:septation ring formation regulator EzrA